MSFSITEFTIDGRTSRLQGTVEAACRMLRGVFNAYLEDPSLLGGNAVRRVRREGLERSVCDYLSGMTDGYLLEEYARLCGLPASPSLPRLDLEVAD